jgi:phosphatidylethanolamine/phosphatidyl-N-methylethanolamine N-methyltransferase
MRPVYDRLAPFYDRAFRPLEKWFLARWRSETLSLLPRDGAVLELGAGTGANFEFYPRSRLAVSTELSSQMLELAAAKVRSNVLVQADAQWLPFAENAFDAAFATLVFCSIPKPAAAFAELRRVLKPNGRIVLLEHVRPPGSLGRAFDMLNLVTVALIDDHFNRETARTAEASGLRIIEIRKKARGCVNLIVCENPDSAMKVLETKVD